METGRRIRRAVLFLCLAAVAVGGLRIGFAAFSGREGAEEEALQTAFALLWRGQYPRAGNPDGSRILEMAFSLSPLCRLGMETLEERSREESQDPAFAAYLENRDFLAAYGRAAPAREKAGADPGTGTDPAAGMDPAAGGDPAAGIDPAAALTGLAGDGAGAVREREPVYSMEQLADYDFLMKTFYSVHPSTTAGREEMDAGELLSQDLSLEKEGDGPQILIYHSHSQETYADCGPDRPEATVVGVGAYLAELLRGKGYQVIHDTSVYDLRDGKLDRSQAYTYALEGITAILQEHPSIEVVLDLHRDGVAEDQRLVAEVGGKPTAKIMFFNGMSQTPDGPIEYLPNPYRKQNLAFSLQMQMKAETYFPGWARKIYLKGLRYNLHVRPRSSLVEVGAQTNTFEEAKNAMEPLAEVLDMVLQGK